MAMTDDELIAATRKIAANLSSAGAARIVREAADRIAQLTSVTDTEPSDDVEAAWLQYHDAPHDAADRTTNLRAAQSYKDPFLAGYRAGRSVALAEANADSRSEIAQEVSDAFPQSNSQSHEYEAAITDVVHYLRATAIRAEANHG